uniref:NADH-ubiquinone oxidoreductase chain 2 n=1 Tax=Clanoptilus assimilis TaxID=1205594 RepID=A0A0S2MRN8_9CUCU|nr:NADH deshydrogenase subunit 2 [Clanoptilus assimilis]
MNKGFNPFLFNKFMNLFLNMMIMGTLISISSYSWLGMWMGLEINLISIIPLLKSKSLFSSEASIKYFLTQALASALIMFSIIMMMEKESLNISHLSMMIMSTGLLTKMGAAPFHFWFPEILEGLNWINSLLMLTWQKVAPMVLLMYNSYISWFFYIIILSSMIVSSMIGFNQTSIRKILAYSSINNIGWMMPCILFSQMIWLIYLIIYIVISINLVMIFLYYNIFHLNQLNMVMNFSTSMKLITMFNFLSLGGLPPFIGFYSKWLVISLMMEQKFSIMILIMIMFTLLVLYYYIRMMFSTMMFSYSMVYKKFYANNYIMMMNLISLMILPLMILL